MLLYAFCKTNLRLNRLKKIIPIVCFYFNGLRLDLLPNHVIVGNLNCPEGDYKEAYFQNHGLILRIQLKIRCILVSL